jgi:hypothetical protein
MIQSRPPLSQFKGTSESTSKVQHKKLIQTNALSTTNFTPEQLQTEITAELSSHVYHSSILVSRWWGPHIVLGIITNDHVK